MSSVGNSLREGGRLPEAVPHLEEALSLHRSALGTNHPYTITCMGHLASAYRDAKKLELALPLFREILALTRLERSPEHPYVAKAIRDLAYASLETDHAEEACALFTELLATDQTAHGSNDARTLKTKTRLAESQYLAKRHGDAVTNSSEVLRSLLQVGQPEPATLDGAFSVFLVASLKINHAAEALPLLEEVLQRFEGSSITTNKKLCAVTQKLINVALDSGKLSSEQRARARALLDRQGRVIP
jgi:tetratricopeptide (TPR) repeat protein